MSEKRPIDLAAVREARARLREIARDHPELLDAPSDENVTAWEATLEEVMSENDEQIVVRLPRALVERVDAHVEKLKKEQPGMRITRSDAVRMMLTRALDDTKSKGKR